MLMEVFSVNPYGASRRSCKNLKLSERRAPFVSLFLTIYVSGLLRKDPEYGLTWPKKLAMHQAPLTKDRIGSLFSLHCRRRSRVQLVVKAVTLKWAAYPYSGTSPNPCRTLKFTFANARELLCEHIFNSMWQIKKEKWHGEHVTSIDSFPSPPSWLGIYRFLAHTFFHISYTKFPSNKSHLVLFF